MEAQQSRRSEKRPSHFTTQSSAHASCRAQRSAEREIEIELGFELRQLSKECPSMTSVEKNFQRNFSHAALAARPAKVSAVDNKSRGGFDLPPHA